MKSNDQLETISSPPPLPRHGGQIVRSASGYLDTRIALHAMPRSGSENSPPTGRESSSYQQIMSPVKLPEVGGNNAFLTSFYDNVTPTDESRRPFPTPKSNIPPLGSPDEFDPIQEEDDDSYGSYGRPGPSKIPIPSAESESKIKAKFLAKYGGGFLKKAQALRPVPPTSPSKDFTPPKDPGPSSSSNAPPGMGEYGFRWKGAERKISLESESMLSTDSRESVVSAASMRAENKVRRHFNY